MKPNHARYPTYGLLRKPLDETRSMYYEMSVDFAEVIAAEMN
jgi:hypothetical protein